MNLNINECYLVAPNSCTFPLIIIITYRFFCFCDIWDKLHSARGQVARPRRVWGFELSPLSSGATHEICAEPMRKYWGTPSPRNVVSANTLVLVAHLVTFSESQWYQFHVQLVGLIIYKTTLTVINLKYCDDLAYWSATQM